MWADRYRTRGAGNRPELASTGDSWLRRCWSLVTLAIVFAPRFRRCSTTSRLVQTIDWHRDLMTVGLCVAILAGIGMDVWFEQPTGSRRSFCWRACSSGVSSSFAPLVGWHGGPVAPGCTLRRDSLTWPLVTGPGSRRAGGPRGLESARQGMAVRGLDAGCRLARR